MKLDPGVGFKNQVRFVVCMSFFNLVMVYLQVWNTIPAVFNI